MKKTVSVIALALLLAGCSGSSKQSRTGSGGWITPPSSGIGDYSGYPVKGSGVYPATPFDQFIRQASNRYEVDETLIRAIIEVESSYRPDVISKSNAVGLMQIKASTAGRDAYRVKGRNGEPSTRELLDPQTNIDIGTTYIRIIRDQHLAGITDPQTLNYATIVSYVNGAGALLRTFDNNRALAIEKINALSADEFYEHVQSKHPASQAPRYLWKVKNAYRALAMTD
ncbi:TPA: transglycosylase SLT domain-containing protein [Morganella morganii]|uniref:transglycosylase SLT domain-containing protein n=1 Tax=Morganella morganii TaxID=582 RepID=UPI001BD9F8CA|nr:transglycosylase SLT domain-containing protein [Morganella morganii subsp. morganii]HDU8609704.1 transglycosylase SLT domain-containing protein [Morganella morganii]